MQWLSFWELRGLTEKAQQDCADLDSGFSQASLHDSGPWSEYWQMRLEASGSNTGEFMGH